MKLQFRFDNKTQFHFPRTKITLLEMAFNKCYSFSAKAVVDIHLVGEKMIQNLNRDYRNKDVVTDVLSFAVMDDIHIRERKVEFPQDPIFFTDAPSCGDVFVCIPQAIKQAEDYHNDTNTEIQELIVHGVFHLFGLDHIKENEKEEMRKHEERINKYIKRL